jgi:hypothetical protein
MDDMAPISLGLPRFFHHIHHDKGINVATP